MIYEIFQARLYGASMFLKQSMMERGDDYYIAICNKTGTLAVYNSNNNVYMSLFSDGPLKFSGNTVDNLNLENVTQFGRSFSIVRVPYAFKLLMQELQVMNIQMRIITEDNVSQFDSMAYGKTVNIDFNKLQETKKLTRKKSKPKEEEPDEGVGDGVDDGVDEQESTTEEPDEQESPTEEPGGVVGDESPTEEEDNETEEEMLKYLNPVTVESIMKARQEAELYKDDNSDDGSEDEDKKPALTMGETLPENALNIDSLKNLGNNDKIKIGNVIDPANLANKGNGGIDEIVLSSEIIDNKNTEKSKNVLMEVADEDLTVENNESGEDSNDSNDSKDTKGIKLIV